MNILFLRVGSFSNLNYYLHEAMCHSHNVVQNVDAGKVIKRKSFQFSSWYNILHTIYHFKKYWRQSHSKNTFAFSQMTNYCNRFIRSRTDYDIIFQTQCKFSIAENPYSRPYYIYTDLTQKLTDRIWQGWALKGSVKENTNWYRLESEAFHRADKIFTFNDQVKASFIDDYHINPEKIVVIGSGINQGSNLEIDFDMKNNREFTLFFLTTEFDRQGGPTVVKSYELIKQKKSNIKLIIGGKCPRNLPSDIEVQRDLSPQITDKIFNETNVFLMPGQLGGVQSVLQAMSKKCLCIVGDSNVLLAGLIDDNQTGIIVRTGEPVQLANRIIELLESDSLRKKIADQAYCLAYENFTWDHIVQKMTQYFKN
jgi:glycosyltransferase involved in cell wall biosynthesis